MVKLFSKNSNLCDHNSPTSQTDGRTDRQTTCDRNTALCTKVHRAIKMANKCGVSDYKNKCNWKLKKISCYKRIARPLVQSMFGQALHSPVVFWHFFPNGWEFLINFFTRLLYVHIYARLQICIELSPILMKLCHTKRDHISNFWHFTGT